MDGIEDVLDENSPVSTDAVSSTVKMLPKNVATQICTSQVIISAAGAVRQLLDNAMDAGAKNIEVTTLNFGFDCIRVTDDGTGIEEENFESLCKRHATSKITEYSDLLALSTLGFRGEALNALCALGSVTITTRTIDKSVGTRLHFDHNGTIERREIVPRETGTTVEVRSLFTTLPVRRKEFERTAKRDHSKVMGVVQEFALATPSIRFNVFSELNNGKRHHALSTAGGDASLGQVITDLFGTNASKNDVIEIKSSDDTSDMMEEGEEMSEMKSEAREIQLDGFVSSPIHGNGRMASDRQFVYVNGRPVDYPKVCRAVNEIYQVHNKRQYPTLVLRIRMPADWVDVNVTPDKRLVFCQKERALLHSIRSTITSAFKPYENQMATLDKSTVVKKEIFSQSFASSPIVKSPEKSNKRKRLSLDSEAADSSLLSSANSELDETYDRMNSVLEELHARDWGLSGGEKKRKSGDGASGERRGEVRPNMAFRNAKTSSGSTAAPVDTVAAESIDEMRSAPDAMNGDDPRSTVVSINTIDPAGFRSREICQPQVKKSRVLPSASSMGMKTLQAFSFKITPHVLTQRGAEKEKKEEGENRMEMDTRRRLLNRSYDEEREREEEWTREITANREAETGNRQEEGDGRVKMEILCQQSIKREVQSQSLEGMVACEGEDTVDQSIDRVTVACRKEQKLNCSLKRILKMREELGKRMEEEEKKEKEKGMGELQEGLSTQNEAEAEEQLRRAIRKSDFADMEVIGQFNSGFIITKLNGHLFIVDQHASDEKANFEKFQKSAIVKNQETIRPQRLDVGAVAEAVVKDNIGVFNASGFQFAFPDDGSGAQLTSLPVVHGASFDRKDIDELISALTLNPGVMVRPSKLNKVFASKACRSSVMIGARLTKEKMKGIVNQLGRLDHPWSCPHGRPTLRHLINLEKIENY